MQTVVAEIDFVFPFHNSSRLIYRSPLPHGPPLLTISVTEGMSESVWNVCGCELMRYGFYAKYGFYRDPAATLPPRTGLETRVRWPQVPCSFDPDRQCPHTLLIAH